MSNRQCFEGILWILWTGAQWKVLPKELGSSSAVHRRLCQWAKDGTLLDLWCAFLRYQKRWKVERTSGSLQNFRHVVIRYAGRVFDCWLVGFDGVAPKIGFSALDVDNLSVDTYRIL